MSDFQYIDIAVRDLQAGLPGWLDTPLGEKIRLLESARRRLGEESDGMVEAACEAQGCALDGPWIGHQGWGLLGFLYQLRAFEEVLGRINAGKVPLHDSAVHTMDGGQVAVDVFPVTASEKVLFSSFGYRAQVWMQPGATAQQVQDDAARAYRGHGFDHPGVALALGAGNVASLPAMDVVNLLYAEGCVVALKMNPVNAYLRPYFERIFADFVDRRWLRFVDGGAQEGQYLAHHPGIDRMHMTGSAATYNTLVWGAGEEGVRNRAAGTPLVDKPFSCELGGVNPMIVVPGKWSAKATRRMADKIVGSKLFNCGHICASPQIVILPEGWPQSDGLLNNVRELLRSLPPNPPYYPGSAEKVARAVAGRPGAEPLQGDGRVLVTDLAPDEDASLFSDEVFADVLGVVRLPAATLEEYLAAATEFANERLAGSLAATMLVHPATIKAHRQAVHRVVADLRYGSIGVNEWGGLPAGLGYTTWGGYPGATPQAIDSGIGVVNNAFLLRNPQKTVVTASFRSMVKPPTAASHRTHGIVMRRLVKFGTTDHVTDVPGVFLAALRA